MIIQAHEPMISQRCELPYARQVVVLGCKMVIASNRWNLIAVVYDTNRLRVDMPADDKL